MYNIVFNLLRASCLSVGVVLSERAIPLAPTRIYNVENILQPGWTRVWEELSSWMLKISLSSLTPFSAVAVAKW